MRETKVWSVRYKFSGRQQTVVYAKEVAASSLQEAIDLVTQHEDPDGINLLAVYQNESVSAVWVPL